MDPNLRDEVQGQDGKQELPSIHEQKIIINCGSGEVVKGYIELNGDIDSATFLDAIRGSPGVLPVRTLGTKALIEIQLSQIKSAYFVKSFRGNPERKDLRFYSNGPAVGSIWVEIRFKDNEVLEGLIENSAQHLIGDGFFLRPSDLGGNNLAVYVNKAAIASYRVLGVRAHRNSGG